MATAVIATARIAADAATATAAAAAACFKVGNVFLCQWWLSSGDTLQCMLFIAHVVIVVVKWFLPLDIIFCAIEKANV